MEELEKLFSKIQNYNSDADFALIERAYLFAKKAHEGQKRLSGEPVIIHPLSVAEILADYKMDSVSVAAGLLHDVIEDAEVTVEQLEKQFGLEVAKIVDGVTKVSRIKLKGSSEEMFVENLRKMILAMSKDLRVVLVKLADRLHNMQTLQYLLPEKQVKNAKETLEVYAPLAERLGIGEIKGKLEDLAFPYMFPEEYKKVVEYSSPYYKKAQDFLEKASHIVYKELAEEGIRAKVMYRPKHIYSLWRKLQRPEINNDITKIYDLMAMRIITESVRDCYGALGIVHGIWKPVPWIGISDFIAQPKPNGYRSIHTKVFSLHERILELQIRTSEMQEQAERGVAAHWFYAETKSHKVTDEKLEKGQVFTPTEKLSWVKQMVAWQKEIVDSKEYVEALKFDALAQRIFVFSPKGDVYDLPLGATAIDFAYGVHTDLGDHTSGAKVNGKMVPLSFVLKSGDMVEILDRENGKPSNDWLNFAVTNLARRHISRLVKGKM